MSEKRLDYLDMAKGIGIFLVVLGHIEFIQESTLRFIFSFHMPLFFVIGGMLGFLTKEQEKSVLDVLRKKAQGILLPYASFSLILLTMAVTGYLVNPDGVPGETLARQFIDSFTGYGLHTLWFLPAYFLANTSFYLLNRYQKPIWRNVTILALAALALGVSKGFGLKEYVTWDCSLAGFAGWNLLIVFLRAILAQPFLLLGWYLAKELPKLPKGVQRSLPLLLFLGSLLAGKLPIFDLHYLYVEPLHYLSAALSCTGLLCLVRMLPKSLVLSWLGRNSLIIMCTHASLYVIYYVSLGMFFIRKFVPMTEPVFNISVAVWVCIAEIPIVWIFHRYFRHLLGRKKQNPKSKAAACSLRMEVENDENGNFGS